MNIDDFWTVIETARTDAASASGDPSQAFASALVERLAATSKQTILEYQQCFDQLHGAIYRRDMWATGHLIGGGCSDDAFMDFRAGLIAQGRQWYERAATAPDVLAQHPDVIAAAVEGTDEARCSTKPSTTRPPTPTSASTATTAPFYDDYDQFCGPRTDQARAEMGESFDFNGALEMQARFPGLARLFLEHNHA
ncbi:DUF4240 domain-containing protein [Streptomyces sp. NPDC102476]|uniref:DUF4240 domain-containing protein n=1 Tax=Streptomyces sp. NPDC102476 TaxID=3366181 RepID=UPI003821C7BA